MFWPWFLLGYGHNHGNANIYRHVKGSGLTTPVNLIVIESRTSMILTAAKATNPIFRKHIRRGREITIRREPIIHSGQSVMLLGSCFAEEIRNALHDLSPNIGLLPDYNKLDFSKSKVRVDELPDRNHMNYYSVFTVLQEVERCLGHWDQASDDYWETEQGWQDPYRRLVIGTDRNDVHEMSNALTRLMRDAFSETDHFVFTFGMTEVFRNRVTGRYAAQKPGYFRGGGKSETDFVLSSFTDNYERILRLSDLIAASKPNAKIFVSVSPVALSMTFTEQDICVANCQSKSVLRAAVGEAANARSNLIYVPSFEAVIGHGPDGFERDGRHVKRDVVRKVTTGFCDAFLARASGTPALTLARRP